MKINKYTILVNDKENNFYLFNSFNFSILKISKKNIIEMFQYNDIKKIDTLSEQEKKILIDQEFIIKDEINEKKMLNIFYNYNKFDLKSSSIVISLTEECNFNCYYCYQKDINKKSSISTKILKEKILNFIKFLILSKYCNKNLSITWYGGEPLLKINYIVELSKSLINLCDNNNIEYSASIITNGYLIDNSIIEYFNKLKIKSIQITIDGNKKYHDSRRVLKNGKGTYDEIMRNLKLLAKNYNGKITIRINIDENNMNDIDELIDDLLKIENIKDKFIISFAPVTKSCKSNNKDYYFQLNNYYNFEYKMKKKYSKLLNINISNDLNFIYSCYCSAELFNSFLIDSKGNLYKCYEEIGKEEYKIGNLLNMDNNYNLFYINSKSKIFNNFDIFRGNDKCYNCKYFLLCRGGCPYFYNYNNIKNEPMYCEVIKDNINNKIINFARELYENL